jgi:hypothetical protein
MAAVGLLAVVAQVLVAYAATLARPDERGALVLWAVADAAPRVIESRIRGRAAGPANCGWVGRW